MKTALAALAASLIAAGGAYAGGPRDNALSHIAQVIATAQLCPDLEANDIMVGQIARHFDIDFDRDRGELLKMVDLQMLPWRGKPPGFACSAGYTLYGPSGADVPGLLMKR